MVDSTKSLAAREDSSMDLPPDQSLHSKQVYSTNRSTGPNALRTFWTGLYTAANLEREQLVSMARRKLHSAFIPLIPVDWDQRYSREIPNQPTATINSIQLNNRRLRSSLNAHERMSLHHRGDQAARGNLELLGIRKDLAFDDGFPPQSADVPFLWWLKLYSFEPLAWIIRSTDPTSQRAASLSPTFSRWISSWIESTEIGEPGYLRGRWTPWGVARRIQHWLQYLAWMNAGNGTTWGDLSPNRFKRRIYANTLFLENHIEWDVGGNHLIDNASALIFAGIAFEAHDTGWLELGLSILHRVCERQFLSDGCHFERSSMYHALAVYNLVTVIDLLSEADYHIPEELNRTAIRASEFLAGICGPDGSMPLLNDAVYNESPPVDCLLPYAKEILSHGSQSRQSWPQQPGADHSGYHWIRNCSGALLIDAGQVCPLHLPGHAHSDLLNILLWVGETSFITDTGTYSYVAGARRQFARGVRGHNTIQVGTSEPIPIAGKYLMGPRPTPESHRTDGRITLFEGKYSIDGYSHHRGIYCGDTWWFIRDLVSGTSGTPVTSRFHLHPDVEVTHEGNENMLRLSSDNSDDVCWFHCQSDGDISLEPGWYYPEFGHERSRDVLTITETPNETDPVCLEYVFTEAADDPILIDVDANGVEVKGLTLGQTTYSLPRYRLREEG